MRSNMTTNTTAEGRTARLFRSDDQRWEAVRRRDRGADGTFCCAVRTTGIYCRPSCSARLPRRGNVEFYATPAQAEAAGYRACKRCKPKEAAA
jgi:AraC family transcriptional regulator, regulatory protein of adaptative response / methylated-DNA-[protein]-cysteine methyltransferase